MSAHDSTDNRHTRRIAEFVSNLQYDDIPDEVKGRIKLLVLDSLGCALYGANLPWTNIQQEVLSEIDHTRTTTIWGTELKLSPAHAALINGTQVQGFELDDVHLRYLARTFLRRVLPDTRLAHE